MHNPYDFVISIACRRAKEFAKFIQRIRASDIMLVLSRKIGERILIGDDIAITVVRITGGGVRLGIEAPNELPVIREELKQRLDNDGSNDHASSDSRTTDFLS